MYSTRWRTEEPQGGREWSETETDGEKGLILAMWQTDAAKYGMNISDEFWRELRQRSREVTGVEPEIPAGWASPRLPAWTFEDQVATVPSERSMGETAWGELMQLKKEHPYVHG
jgi:hypothetical protein